MLILLRRPSAWIPLATSAVALAMVLGYAALVGVVRQPDEGAPARIFQVVMAAQLPVIAWFALTWLPRRPREASAILLGQVATWLAPVIAILLLEA